jgi:hypothetical protein
MAVMSGLFKASRTPFPGETEFPCNIGELDLSPFTLRDIEYPIFTHYCRSTSVSSPHFFAPTGCLVAQIGRFLRRFCVTA